MNFRREKNSVASVKLACVNWLRPLSELTKRLCQCQASNIGATTSRLRILFHKKINCPLSTPPVALSLPGKLILSAKSHSSLHQPEITVCHLPSASHFKGEQLQLTKPNVVKCSTAVERERATGKGEISDTAVGHLPDPRRGTRRSCHEKRHLFVLPHRQTTLT